ncbi:hypothetical protein [Paraflavitalea speifideaquila]|uniref:hypothetical protein n=1 Tax=Paraflavitalea speifideaquila TaxID=3076558 RepID=UPI0028E75254|nr:hypothetical protein [Paraflavitalea speifideiaquila]
MIKIPVVVHVLYNTPDQNISDAQIKSQIEVLNKDFRKLNGDTVNIPAMFKHLAADCQLEFELAKIDPSGRATTGITRRNTSIMMYGLDDRIKFSNKGDGCLGYGALPEYLDRQPGGWVIGICEYAGLRQSD